MVAHDGHSHASGSKCQSTFEMKYMPEINNDVDKLARLEMLGKVRPKIPLRQEFSSDNLKIGRLDALSFKEKMKSIESNGVSVIKDSSMGDVMQHNYLRKSIEQRVENKVLIRNYRLKEQ